MALAYLPIIQQILSGLTNSTISNGTAAEGSLPSAPAAPTDLSSLIAFLFSFSALRDWFKLLIIGGFLETCRRYFFTFYNKVIESFFITATFEEGDSSYGEHLRNLGNISSHDYTQIG